ncbi:MAG: ABC transporter substrate-binding protein [Dehalococcoidia bacterium]|nr:ABC transporter substrate-binding protein [Dehalococcoidia bacterium]
MEESNYWTRLSRRRISRRALLGAGATTALGGAAAVVVGCGGGGNEGPNGVTGTARPTRSGVGPFAGGSLTFGRGIAALGIDPHLDLTGLDIDSLLYSYLYDWRPGTEEMVFNNLATAFEQPDPEHLQFIFTLRPGVKIHQGGPGAGEEMTSEDCKQTFIRRGVSLTAPDKRFPHKIAGSANPEDLGPALQTPDKYTFSFNMKEPFVPALREMANATWAIVPAKVIEKFPSLSQTGFGSGPFMLEEFRGAERIVLKKHPEYFLAPRPWLDGLTYIVITENSSLLSAFENGQHDVNGAFLTKKDAEDLQNNGDIVVGKAPSLFYPVIHMKMKPPFSDVRVRKAIDLALDRDEMIAIIQAGEGNYNGPIQWPQEKWALPQEELRAFYKSDPEQAKSILEEAGYGDGFSAKMKVPKLTGPSVVGDIAALIQAQLERANIHVQRDEVELGAFIGNTLLPGNFEMAFFPNLPYDEPDRPLAFYHSLGVTGSGNWTNYRNKELDKIIDAQSREFDEAKRKELIFQAQRMILEEHGPQITLAGGFAHSAHWNYVHFPYELGEEPPEDAGPFGTDIWTEKV